MDEGCVIHSVFCSNNPMLECNVWSSPRWFHEWHPPSCPSYEPAPFEPSLLASWPASLHCPSRLCTAWSVHAERPATKSQTFQRRGRRIFQGTFKTDETAQLRSASLMKFSHVLNKNSVVSARIAGGTGWFALHHFLSRLPTSPFEHHLTPHIQAPQL